MKGRDDELRAIFTNAGTLLTGQAGAAMLQLAALALTARALGPDQYGVLVLVQTWVLVVDRLFNFQSWQVVIRYGATALEAGDQRGFRSVVKLALALDAAGALVGAAAAVGAIAAAARLFDWSGETARIGAMYSAVILFHLGGAATGVLRLFDRFRRFALQTALTALLRLALVAWAYLADAELWTFAVAWAVADAAGALLLFALGWAALAREGHPLLSGSIAEARARHPDLIRFAILTNLETTVRQVFRELDVFLVRAFLDTAAVGQYGLIKQIGSLPERLTNPLYHSALPVIARLWAKRELAAIRRQLQRTGRIGLAFAAALVVGFLAFGRIAVELVFGAQYGSIYLPAAIALVGASRWAASYAYSAVLVAMGLVREKLRLTALTSVAAVVLQVVLLPRFGLIGATTAYALVSVIWSAAAVRIVRAELRRAESTSGEA